MDTIYSFNAEQNNGILMHASYNPEVQFASRQFSMSYSKYLAKYFINSVALRSIAITVLTIYLSFGITLQSSAQSWYNDSWSYRKSHSITGSAGAGTNYQIRLVAHKSAGTDAGADVYMGSNVRDDFADVRFTASDGTTLLDYWMETGSLTSGSQAAFWVEVAADLGSNQSIYIYCGNNSATTASNGLATFPFFDDFTGTNLDTKWTKIGGGTLSFSGGLMSVTAPNTDPSKIIATGGSTSDNLAIVARFQVTGGANTDERVGVGVHTSNTTNQGYNYVLRNLTARNEASFLNDGTAWYTLTYNWLKNTNYIIELFYNGTNARGRLNYGTWVSQAMTGKTGYAALNIGSFDATSIWDWAFIRKCILTEPSHGAWGTMESAPYTWTPVSSSTDWQVTGNWTPNRTTPLISDILQFNSGGSVTVTNVPTQTIGQLLLSNSTTVNLQSAAVSNTLTLNNVLTTTAGDVLSLGTGVILAGTLTTLTNNGKIQTAVPTSTTATPVPVGKTWGGTIEYNGISAQTCVGGTYASLIINATAAATTVTSSTQAFTVSNLTISQGNLILQATNANYSIANDLNIAANGTLTHSVSWDNTSMLLSVGGNINNDGIFTYTVRSHVQMTGSGTKYMRTGSNPASAFSILTLINGNFYANGTLKVNDNFWAMFGTTGSFHTNGQTVTASAAVLINAGTVYIDGGTLNVNGGIAVGTGNNGAVEFSSGILNTDGITIGNGTQTGTFAQSGGTTNLSGSLLINSSCSFTCTNSPIINIGGDWTKNGTYTKATETVTFNRIGDQTIGGTTATSFYNLTFSGSGAKTVPAGTSVTGNLNISDAKANLIAGINVQVNSFSLSGAGQPAGTWGSTSSAATHKNNTYFTATTGIITVATGAALPTPTFTNLTASQGICPGTAMALSGTVSAGSVYPANGETVGVTINGVTQNATIAGGAGGFSINFNTSAIPASATPYTITYSYEGGIYLTAAVNNVSTAVTVNILTAAVISQTNITCFDAHDGTITIMASGGSGIYSYSVDGGATWIPSAINPYPYGGLAANTPYRIKVNDSNGCVSK